MAAVEQCRLSMPAPNSNSSACNSSDESDESSAPKKPMQKKAITKQVKDNTLAFYQGGWKLVAARSKEEYEYHIAVNHFFPTRERDLHDASLIIGRQINAALQQGIILDNSEFCFLIAYTQFT